MALSVRIWDSVTYLTGARLGEERRNRGNRGIHDEIASGGRTQIWFPVHTQIVTRGQHQK